MKRTFIIGLLLLAGSWAQASLSFSSSPNQTVNAVGTAFTGTISGAGANQTASAIVLTLDVSGGYSGGFYMYLVGPDGITLATLLNTPGTSTLGLNITMEDGGTAITSGSNLGSGTYAPYQPLSGLNSELANGTWTLYFANLSSDSGSDPATLVSWSLTLTPVPEPVTDALAVFGLVFVGVGAGRLYLARRRSPKAS